MTRSELVVEVAASTKLPRTVVRRVLLAMSATIQTTAKTGETVTLPGFGTFYAVDQQPRELFGEGKKSALRRKIRFRQSRRS